MKKVLEKVLTDKRARDHKTLEAFTVSSAVVASPWGWKK